MSRIPSLLGMRIDRLSRAAHRFHRYAHHPLCDEYAGEVVRLGKRSRVCRGCLLVFAGGLVGGTASLFVGMAPRELLLLWMVAVLGLVFTMTRRSSAGARAPKAVSRFLPALAIGYALGGTLQLGPRGWALAAVSALPLFVAVALYRRRGPDRSPCATCVERNRPIPCRGIAPIVRRERAFQRLAGRWLARADLDG